MERSVFRLFQGKNKIIHPEMAGRNKNQSAHLGSDVFSI